MVAEVEDAQADVAEPEGTTLTGTINLAAIAATTHLTFGAGYIGGTWPHEDNNGQNAGVDFLNGQLADITLTQ